MSVEKWKVLLLIVAIVGAALVGILSENERINARNDRAIARAEQEEKPLKPIPKRILPKCEITEDTLGLANYRNAVNSYNAVKSSNFSDAMRIMRYAHTVKLKKYAICNIHDWNEDYSFFLVSDEKGSCVWVPESAIRLLPE